MKRKFLFVGGCLFLILSSSMVFASDGVNTQGQYVAARLGVCFLNDVNSEEGVPLTIDAEFDTGIGFEAAMGYDFGMYRIEGEIGYRKNDVDTFSALGVSVPADGDLDALSFMANGYLDFENQTALTPFIGAGIGWSVVSTSDISVWGIPVVGNRKDTVFAYQFGVGVGYSATDSLIIDIAYKYFATSDPEFEGIKGEYNSHNISLGIRLTF
jgi:opacity protein-like surface antigen